MKKKFPAKIVCKGDSLWGMTRGLRIKVSDVEIDEKNRLVYVYHDKPWWVCTDTGFERGVSQIVGKQVASCETDMQEDEMTVMEW